MSLHAWTSQQGAATIIQDLIALRRSALSAARQFLSVRSATTTIAKKNDFLIARKVDSVLTSTRIKNPAASNLEASRNAFSKSGSRSSAGSWPDRSRWICLEIASAVRLSSQW
jgi:hypothetical protein